MSVHVHVSGTLDSYTWQWISFDALMEQCQPFDFYMTKGVKKETDEMIVFTRKHNTH